MYRRASILLIASLIPCFFMGCQPDGGLTTFLPSGMRILAERGGGVPSPDLTKMVRVSRRGELYIEDFSKRWRYQLGVWVRMPVNPGPGIIMWSPDSRRVAISAWGSKVERQNRRPDIFVFELKGQRVRLTTKFPGVEGLVAWSPDAKVICFGAYYDERTSPYRLGNLETRRLAPLFRSLNERYPKRWIYEKGERGFRDSLIFQPSVWSPDGRILGGAAGIVADKFGSMVLPATFDLRSRNVTVYGRQPIAGPDSVLGFSRDSSRLYCMFAGSAQSLEPMSRATFPGYIEIDSQCAVHLFRLPGYVISETKLLRSADNFLVLERAGSLSPDCRYLAMWEVREPSGQRQEAIRLVVWNVSDKPRREKTFQIDRSQEALFNLLKDPEATHFSSDGRKLYALFASGAVVEYILN